ncbi:nucleoside triphosphate pyrophosphohydrolase family protein [Methylomicrobium agile]|uniref:nucleoside triphosphate pyrophosphohydrolase family protein n=1 Tax=Methylomicrobium agile TaxID=39774 RepID=UPI0004DF4187|nr:nucleoside triphosphate pyrophosphohydrolase family protein [Methylomicrobium agile]
MNKHLQSVREFREHFGFSREEGRLSDMTIVLRQAWLMEGGKQVFLAIKQGDMTVILARLTGLAYLALNAVAMQGAEVNLQPVSWQHDGSVLSLMRLIGDRINVCSSGLSEDYSALYCACAQLSGGFLNADFDKSFGLFHRHQMETGTGRGQGTEDRSEVEWNRLPDLSDCLYE